MRSPRRGLSRTFAPALAALALVGSLLTATPASAALEPLSASPVAASMRSSSIVKAAPVVGFNPENIINDALFYDENAMTSAEIQAFLDRMIGACATSRCLNVLSVDVPTRAKDFYSQTTGNLVCRAMAGGKMRVSELIYRVQQSCGISAKVTLVTLQKEQSLVSGSMAKAPSDSQLRKAMGHLCPDTAPCDASAAGVANQIVGGVEQLKKYKATAFGKQPGRNWIGYNPEAACGGTFLNIQNYATAALYNFTPYQPNAAALRAGSGFGDTCSSYGNRNFYNFYTSWFGSTQAAVDPCKPPSPAATTAAGGEYVTTTALNARSAPTTACSNIIRTLPQGTLVSRSATFDGWWLVREGGSSFWVHSDYLTAAPPVSYTASRLSGVDRYETATTVSKSVFPAGASTVLIASGTEFPDALAAGAAAGSAGAALLLIDPNGLPTSVANELVRLNPSKVVLVGSEVRISSAVANAIAEVVPAASIERVAGINRYETSRMLADRFFPTASMAYVVTGLNYADAVVASSLGAAKKAPVVLVEGSAPTLEQATIDTLKKAGVRDIVIAGRDVAVSGGIATALTSAGFQVRRIGGVDRYQTSQMLSADAYPAGATTALFATGTGYADALTGSVLAAKAQAPLFTTPTTCMTDASKNWLIRSNVKSITLIGGTPVLDAAVAGSVRC